MSKHEHPPEPGPICNHEHLKYCHTCKVVECLDCTEEFVNKTKYTPRVIGQLERLYRYSSYPPYNYTTPKTGHIPMPATVTWSSGLSHSSCEL